MPDYLKQAPWNAPAASSPVRRRVSEMLSRIEREGEHALRRYSPSSTAGRRAASS